MCELRPRWLTIALIGRLMAAVPAFAQSTDPFELAPVPAPAKPATQPKTVVRPHTAPEPEPEIQTVVPEHWEGVGGTWHVSLTREGNVLSGTIQCYADGTWSPWSPRFTATLDRNGGFSVATERRPGWSPRQVYGRFPQVTIEAVDRTARHECADGAVTATRSAGPVQPASAPPVAGTAPPPAMPRAALPARSAPGGPFDGEDVGTLVLLPGAVRGSFGGTPDTECFDRVPASMTVSNGHAVLRPSSNLGTWGRVVYEGDVTPAGEVSLSYSAAQPYAWTLAGTIQNNVFSGRGAQIAANYERCDYRVEAQKR